MHRPLNPSARSHSLRGALLGLALGLAASCSGESEFAPVIPAGGSPAVAGPTEAATVTPTAGKNAAAQLSFEEAVAHLIRNQPDEAEAKFRRAIELDPDMAEAHFELGRMQVRRSFVTNAGQRDGAAMTEGLGHLRRSCELKPENDLYYYWLGRGLHVFGRLDEARFALNRAVTLDKDNGPAHKRLGLLYKDLNELEKSKASFERAIELLPNGDGCHFQLGLVLEQLGDESGARAAFESAIKMDPTEPGPYTKLAASLAAAGDEEGSAAAEADYQKWRALSEKLKNRQRAVNQDPGDPTKAFALGEINFALEKWEQALVQFQRVVLADPNNAHAHLYCGIAQRHLGDLAAAEVHLLEAIGRSPDSLEPILELLRVLAGQGDMERYDESLARFEKEAPEDRDAQLAVGLVCRELDLASRARRYLARAVELDGQHVESRLAYGDFLLSQGERAGALPQFDAVLALEPENEAALAGRAAATDGEPR